MIIFKILLFPLLLFQTGHTQESAVYINVGQAQVKKSLLALPPIKYVGTQSTNAQHIRAGQNLYGVIVNDLSVSNFFTLIKPEAYLENPEKVGLRPAPGEPGGFNFQNWKTIGTDFLFRGAYQVLGDSLNFEVYVYHVPTAKLILGKSYKTTTSAYRRMAHTFSNDLVKALTGKDGMFLTRLVASRQEMGKEKGNKEIYLMDWDGENLEKISSHSSIATSPTWSTKGDRIAYTAFAYHPKEKVRNADIFVYELKSGKRFLVSYRKGINSGAAYLPGDEKMLLTISQEGSPDIFRMNADGQGLVPLTRGPNRCMNVEPAISPDGRTVAFSSDRFGKPMLFLMDINGGNQRRFVNPGKYNSTPAWSPDGKVIAFAGMDADHFDIFTVNVDGSNLKRLTAAKTPSGRQANNESPSWSPDGRSIVFTSNRTGHYQLYIISPDGTNERRITNDTNNWDRPKWSPYLD